MVFCDIAIQNMLTENMVKDILWAVLKIKPTLYETLAFIPSIRSLKLNKVLIQGDLKYALKNYTENITNF